ncbi:MAG TPA: glycosyltransferase family 4 protein [Rhizobiaceae bacterium]|nr:glycosyltransferase family 4 protein [Rhizobiaceae bacterium]
MKIAFYAPLKTPDHPIPSGDRVVGRLLLEALGRAGYEVELASRVISYQKRPSAEIGAERRLAAEAEAKRLIDAWKSGVERRPDLWFTYHPYCKAPDWIGPQVAASFGIPYVTAEACRTRQATDEDWIIPRQAVQAAARQAAVNFCLKPSDREYLRSFLPDMKTVVRLLPFIDLAAIDAVKAEQVASKGFYSPAPLIVAVGMMRPNAKFSSYQLLAAALSRLSAIPWNLAIVGDGPMRPDIEALFAPLPAGRIIFTGALRPEQVLHWMRAGDLFAWPGFSEAFGMVYLEAQACKLPVAALRTAGVPVVVEENVTGLLTDQSPEAYAEALETLLTDPQARQALGTAGRKKVERDHDIAGAAKLFALHLDPLLYGQRDDRHFT